MDCSQQIEPILVDERMAGKAAERDFANGGDSREFGNLRDQFAVSKTLAGFDIPGEIEPVGPDRVDRPAGKDQPNSRQCGHDDPLADMTRQTSAPVTAFCPRAPAGPGACS